MVHSEKVKHAVNKIESKVDEANSKGDLINILDEVLSLGFSLKSNNTPLILSSLFMALNVFYLFKIGISGDGSITVLMISFSMALLILVYTSRKAFIISDLSDKIFEKKLIFDNELEYTNIEDSFKEIQSVFFDFDGRGRGGEINFLLKGQNQGREHHFDFKYYRFEYIAGGSDGKKQYFYRFGIVFDFQFSSSIAVFNDSPHKKYKGYNNKFKPASLRFNELYSVSCENEMIAAKLLKPAIVNKFEELANDFKKVNFEVNSDGKACLSTSVNLLDTMWDVRRKYGLDQPEMFKQEIAKHRELKKLNAMLDFAHYLMKYSDNNFSN